MIKKEQMNMAKATLTTKDGLKITVEGTPEEVVSFVEKLESGSKSTTKKAATVRTKAPTAKSGPADLIAELIDSGFFKTPQELGAIRLALQDRGHYYPATTLSPILLRFVRSKR